MAALLAPAVFPVVNFIDKYVISKQVKDYRGMPIYSAITGLCLGTLFWIVAGFPLLPVKDVVLLLLAGACINWGGFLFFQAISSDETSNIILLFQMTPLLVLILSVLFLKETILPKQALGMVLIFFSCMGASINTRLERKQFRLSRSFFLIFLVDALWATAAIFTSLALHANSFPKILSYESWGLGIGGIILYSIFPVIRSAFHESLRTVRKAGLSIIFFNEGLFVLAKALTYYAYSLGPTAIVSIIGSTEVFFGIVYGGVLSFIANHIFQENMTGKVLARKLLLAMILFIGIWLVY